MSMTSMAMAAAPTATAVAKVVPNQGPLTVAVGAILLGGNVFFIGLRVYSKIAISKTFGLNDIGMMLAVVIYAGLLGLLVGAVKGGVGGHTSSATLVGIGNSLKFIFLLEIIYVFLTSVMKASLALTLLQWARKKSHIWLLWAAIIIDAITMVWVMLFFLLECQPISYAWQLIDPTKKGKCLSPTIQIYVGIALSGTTISLDMMFLFIPFFMMVGRTINKNLKLWIYFVFSLGVFASIANFIRLAGLLKLKASTDALFDAAPVFLWSAVEVSIGIMAAGIIELSPLMRRWGVKGFEDSFDRMDEDKVPIRLQSMDKNTVGFPSAREMA